MKTYATLSLLLVIVTGVFAQCNGGNETCPTIFKIYKANKKTYWTCCDQTRMCSGGTVGQEFTRYQDIYYYTTSTPTGTATHECVSGPTDDHYDVQPLCCPQQVPD